MTDNGTKPLALNGFAKRLNGFQTLLMDEFSESDSKKFLKLFDLVNNSAGIGSEVNVIFFR